MAPTTAPALLRKCGIRLLAIAIACHAVVLSAPALAHSATHNTPAALSPAPARLANSPDFTGKYALGDGVTVLRLKQTGNTVVGVGVTGIGRDAFGYPAHVATASIKGTVAHGVLRFTWRDSWGNQGNGALMKAGASWVFQSRETHHARNALVSFGNWEPTPLKKTSNTVTPEDVGDLGP